MARPQQPTRGIPFGLTLAVLVYIGLRAAILVTGFESVAMRNYELYPMGTLPKALILGGDYPLHLYYDNAAGQLLTGVLAWPSYLLFGDSYLALKLVPAVLGLGCLLALWWLLRMLYGRTASDVGALLFAVGPTELMTKYSLMASGNHFENLFFTTLSIACFVAMQRRKQSRAWLVISGFTAGFALFVFLGFIIPLGLMVLAHLGIRGWRRSIHDLLYVVPAALVGLAPLIYLNLFTGGRGGGFLAAKFVEGGQERLPQIVERLRAFLTEDLWEAGFHGSIGPRDLGPLALPEIGWTLPAGVLLTCLGIAWLLALPAGLHGALGVLRGMLGAARPERGLEAVRFGAMPFLLYPPLAAIAFALSDLKVDRWPAPLGVAGFRYFLPLFLVGIVLLARLCGDERSRLARGTGLLLSLVALGTGAWNLRLIDLPPVEPRQALTESGHNFVQAARGLVGERNALSRAEQARIADSFPPAAAAQLWRGVGYHATQIQVVVAMQEAGQENLVRWVAEHPLNLTDLYEGYPEHARVFLARGAGAGLRSLVFHNRPALEALNANLIAVVAADAPYARLVVEGAACVQDMPVSRSKLPHLLGRGKAYISLLGTSAPDLRAHAARGLGLFIGRQVPRGLHSLHGIYARLLRELYPALGPDRDALMEGVGHGLVDGALEPLWPDALAVILPPDGTQAAARGYRDALEEVYGKEAAREHLNSLPPTLRGSGQ